jgi:hypothetical protein
VSGWMINRDEGCFAFEGLGWGQGWEFVDWIYCGGWCDDCTIDHWILVGEGLYAGRCSF